MKKILLLCNLIILGLVCSINLQAADESNNQQFELGIDYEITGPEVITEPVIEEFFNYACGACYSLEKFVTDFKATHPDIEFKLIPVKLNPNWGIYVKAYYIGEYLKVLDVSHSKLFHRLHVEKNPFKNEKDMKEFFLSIGVTEKSYDDVANSYWLNAQMKLGTSYIKKNKVMKTPTLLVNKRFKLDAQNLGTYDRITSALEYFSAKPKVN